MYVHGGPHRKKVKTHKVARPGSLYTILIKGDKLWRSGKTKGKGLGLLGGKLWEGKYMGGTNGRQGLFRKVCYAGSSLTMIL